MAKNKEKNIIENLDGKVPPQATDMEAAVLGAIIIDSGCAETAINLLTADMFYGENHKAIFEAIAELYGESKAIDALTVVQCLKKHGSLDAAGGAFYVSQLGGAVGSGAHVEYHCKIVLQKYLMRRLTEAGEEIRRTGFDDAADVADALVKSEKLIAGIIDVVEGRRSVKNFIEIVDTSLNEAYRRAAAVKEGKEIGITTGLRDLDAKMFGWENSNLIILAGRPGQGKSALMLHFAKTAARAGFPVVIFALEMSAVSLTDRLMLSFCDVPAYKFRSGYISRDEFYGLDSAAEQLKQLPITIDDTPTVSMSQIRAKARALARTGKCRMVFIDYLQLIKMDLSYGKNVNNAVAEISREAKILAKEINVPVMLLSQLNREVERRADKRPQLSDLRDCLPVAEWVDTPSGVKQLKDKPKRIVSVDISGSRAADCVYIPKKYNSIYTVETHFGSFSATAKHRVLTATGWKYVCDLDAERDILASPKIIAHENRGYIPHGRLLGWLVGNGYLSGTPSLTLRNELMNELPEEIKSFDVEVRPKKTQKSDNVTEVYLSNGVTSGCKPNRLMQWIRELGLEGKTARHKSIPDLYLGTSNEAHLELLRGLWEADGTVSKGIARYSTVSEILARQVKWLLHTIGVRSRIGCEKKENCSDLFTVSCAVVDNANMCRICSNSKRFGWLKMPSGKYIDPAPEIFVRLAQEYGASERIQKKAGGRLKNIAKKRLSKMLENNSISTITESPFMQMQNMSWTKITSISHDEKEVRVCDLHVPETNCFLTNGMVVHNSGAIEQDADIVMFVYRPSYYGIEVAELSGSDKNSGILSVAKFREGAVGDVLFSHNEGLTQVFDYGVGLLGHQGLLGQAETQTDLPF